MDFRRARGGRVLTAGRFSNDSNADGDKRPNVSTSAYEHTVSRPAVDQHAGAYACSDESAHCHSNTVGNGYTLPDGHADTHEHTFSNTGPNRHECSNSHVNSRDIGDIVSYTHACSY